MTDYTFILAALISFFLHRNIFSFDTFSAAVADVQVQQVYDVESIGKTQWELGKPESPMA